MATITFGRTASVVACLALAAACAQAADEAALDVRQGRVLRLTAKGAETSARLNGRTVRLYPQGAGGALGLMPVAAIDKPGFYTLEYLDAQGGVVRSARVRVTDARFPKQNIVVRKEIAELKPSTAESDAVRAFRQNIAEQRYWSDPLAAPVPGCMISPFGVQRLLNGEPTGDYHGGVDLRSAAGRPVRATAAGVVRLARMFELRGGTVAIDHGQGLQSMYLHLSRFAATEGQTVKKGDVIGYVGSTGRSTGPHLHWAIYANGVPVNAVQWVTLRRCSRARR